MKKKKSVTKKKKESFIDKAERTIKKIEVKDTPTLPVEKGFSMEEKDVIRRLILDKHDKAEWVLKANQEGKIKNFQGNPDVLAKKLYLYKCIIGFLKNI